MLEKRLLKVPEVKEVFARTGTAEIATDPMPPSTADGYVMLKPRNEWPDPAQAEGRRRRRHPGGVRRRSGQASTGFRSRSSNA